MYQLACLSVGTNTYILHLIQNKTITLSPNYGDLNKL